VKVGTFEKIRHAMDDLHFYRIFTNVVTIINGDSFIDM